MAKPTKVQPSPSEPPKTEVKPQETIHGYRVERLSQFEYQPFVITKNPDGSFSESKWGKADLIELVSNRIHRVQRTEANDVYQANKKLREQK